MKPALRWMRRVLMSFAVLMLSYCGLALTNTWLFQKAEDRRFEHLLTAGASAVSFASLPVTREGGLIGRMEIPRLGLSVMVMEGTTNAILRRAAGHISGTALPGHAGNVGISAHRDTFFRPLRNIEAGDIVTLATIGGEFRYRVLSTKIVGPEDVTVLHAGKDESLTLVTCYPFYFVGPAPKRFIVRAERI